MSVAGTGSSAKTDFLDIPAGVLADSWMHMPPSSRQTYRLLNHTCNAQVREHFMTALWFILTQESYSQLRKNQHSVAQCYPSVRSMDLVLPERGLSNPRQLSVLGSFERIHSLRVHGHGEPLDYDAVQQLAQSFAKASKIAFEISAPLTSDSVEALAGFKDLECLSLGIQGGEVRALQKLLLCLPYLNYLYISGLDMRSHNAQRHQSFLPQPHNLEVIKLNDNHTKASVTEALVTSLPNLTQYCHFMRGEVIESTRAVLVHIGMGVKVLRLPQSVISMAQDWPSIAGSLTSLHALCIQCIDASAVVDVDDLQSGICAAQDLHLTLFHARATEIQQHLNFLLKFPDLHGLRLGFDFTDLWSSITAEPVMRLVQDAVRAVPHISLGLALQSPIEDRTGRCHSLLAALCTQLQHWNNVRSLVLRFDLVPDGLTVPPAEIPLPHVCVLQVTMPPAEWVPAWLARTCLAIPTLEVLGIFTYEGTPDWDVQHLANLCQALADGLQHQPSRRVKVHVYGSVTALELKLLERQLDACDCHGVRLHRFTNEYVLD